MLDIFEQYRIKRNFICIDLKSFFASVECIDRGLDIFKTNLAVADIESQKNPITLAITPKLKSFGLSGRTRFKEIPKNIDIIYARPRMSRYTEVSSEIIKIYLSFVDFKDIYIYSIDEVFIDLTSYINYYNSSTKAIALKIMNTVLEKTGIYSTCGIGPNMLISKLALDIESKKKSDSIAYWNYDDIEKKLWTITDMTKMWGIGSQTEKRLHRLGVMKIGDIVKLGVTSLKREFGIKGVELYFHALGIDMSSLSDKGKLDSNKSFGQSQVLKRDYDKQEIKVIILEIIDNLCEKLRNYFKLCKTVTLSINYTIEDNGCFSTQKSFIATNNSNNIYKHAIDMLNSNIKNEKIRKVSVSVSNFIKVNGQQSFFDLNENFIECSFDSTVDYLNEKYGKSTVNRAVSITPESTKKYREGLIGGHKAK